jgi:CHAT domain-containing protein/tetratricopeptide (TPR) repeat protein
MQNSLSAIRSLFGRHKLVARNRVACKPKTRRERRGDRRGELREGIDRHSNYARIKYFSFCAAVPILLLLLEGGLCRTQIIVYASSLYTPGVFTNLPRSSLLPYSVFQESVAELQRGGEVKKEITGGETHSFGVPLSVGQYARLAVRCQGIDLNAFVTKPDGTRLSEFDINVIGPGPTYVSIVAVQPGLYKLNVRPAEDLRVTGEYEVKLEDVRAPTPADENSFAAEKALAEAQQRKSKDDAIIKYNEAIQLWRKAEDAAGEADALRSLANRYMLLGDLKKAEENFNAAIALRQKLGDRQSEAYVLVDLGLAYLRLGSQEQGLDFYNRALRKFVEIKDRRGEALARYSIGFASARLGRRLEALTFYQKALEIYQAERDRLSEARTLNSMGGAYGTLGDPDKSLELYQRAALIFRELNDREREAIMINNVGQIYDDWGDWQQAGKNYDDALSIYKSLLKDDWKICGEGASAQKVRICGAAAATMGNKGELYNSLGSPQVATEIFKESLSISRSLNQPVGTGRTLTRICYAAFLQGNYEGALDFCRQALPYSQTATDYPGQASTLTVLGMIQSALNEPRKALEYYSQAMSLKEQPNRRAQAITLDKMGSAYALAGNTKDTFQSYERALQLWREVKDKDGEALTLYNMARGARERGDLAEAHRLIEQAIALVESLRVNVTSQRLRAYYFATKVNSYELDIDVKMQLARKGDGDELVAAALQLNERARARSLLDMLTEARIEILPSATPELKRLLENRAFIQRKLDDRTRALTRLLNGKYQKEQADAMAAEVDRLNIEYDETEARIRMQNPRYASLTKPHPLSLKEIQQEFLDDRTLLLEYALGEQRSYLWVVSSTGIKWYELPKRAEIEEAARRFKQTIGASEKDAGETAQHYRSRLLEIETAYRSHAASLSRMLLGQAGAELKDKRLLIVAEGELQSIPFAALYDSAPPDVNKVAESARDGASTPEEPLPLVARHEVVSLPSATTLAMIRSDRRLRSASKSVAVLADPVFEPDDPRLMTASKTKPPGQTRAPKPPLLEQVSREYALPRLLASRQEARDIMTVVPSGTGLQALDFMASRATATDPSLGQYRVLHFATHSLFNDEYPELSGIVLSLYDERGRPREDGFLRLQDIYNLKLPVELVVLSACRTGLGKNIRGEGLVGLTRGFMYAGAARVIATLWKVDDEATAELMKSFYQHLFRDGMTPAASLRAAQVSMRAQRRWRAPYFWAGFVLHGEWK